MRFLLVALIAALAFAAAATLKVPDYTGYTYESFLNEYRGGLQGATPCPMRKAIFESNLAMIKAHNAEKHSWFMRVNERADMTEEEIIAQFTGLNMAERRASRRLRGELDAPVYNGRPAVSDVSDLPEVVDHTDSIKVRLNQGGCGSCWAFAAAHTLIGRAQIVSGKDIVVSQQQITACTPNPRHCGGTGGCRGATFQLAADYLMNEAGLASDEDYPYTAGSGSTGTCKFDPFTMPPIMTISGYDELPKNNKTALLQELNNGPVSVSVAATTWSFYGGGLFNGCTKNKDFTINHAVTAVGYDLKENSLKILNSWGRTWGEGGFIRLQMNEEEVTGMDKDPHAGAACEDEPGTPFEVVGECGVFADSAIPTGVKVLV